ncbi:MAG: Acetoin:2,6-dichlorophenolindophenol oxidoreductase subunit alpha [Anaerolineales bacterium]|nr:Acetoin:2,6-dichlorophenolindophenol oxidoreductase subunit alpha [Anaerolineales bacterium]
MTIEGVMEQVQSREMSLDGLDLDQETLHEMLYTMRVIRDFEDAAAEWYARGQIAGFLHLYTGEEAVAVGAISALRPDDKLMSHYRDHGHAIAKGSDPQLLMAELFGKKTGIVQGRGGSMHFYDTEAGMLGGYAIIGQHLPLAVGYAFASQYRGEDWIMVCILGDGATNIGYFHEALNFAGLWDTPVLFLVENNLYGMGTAVDRASAITEIHRKADAYGMPNKRIDGMNVIEMHREVRDAVAQVRAGEGPQLLEALTFRYRGHSMADPELYRDKEETEGWRQRDAIENFEQVLLSQDMLTQDEADDIRRQAQQTVDEAVEFARDSEYPPEEDIYADIYDEDTGDELVVWT